MVDELHKGGTYDPAQTGAWEDEVDDGDDGHAEDDGNTQQDLDHSVPSSPDGQTFVPHRGQ